jgi:hypothetical protein
MRQLRKEELKVLRLNARYLRLAMGLAAVASFAISSGAGARWT